MNDIPAPVNRLVGQTFRNSEMVAFYKDSADFRILITQDPVLKACFDTGQSPLQTIIFLADRAEAMRKKCEDLYKNGLPPIYVCLPNVKDHRAGKLCPTSTNDMNPAPVHRLVGHLSFLKDQMTF